MFERLLVLYDQRLVGFLDRESDRISFTYTPEVVDAQEGRIVLSASLRVRSRRFKIGRAHV